MSDPHPPAPTLAEVEKMLAMRADDCIELAEQYEDPEFVPPDPSTTAERVAAWAKQERDEAAHYRLALSCVRAVRAPAYLVVLDKNDVPISTWKRDERLSLGEQEAKMRAVFNDEDFPHHRPFTLLPLYALPAAILTALPEPPHA